MRAEADRLLRAEREHPERHEAVVEELVDPLLQRAVEVDHHVAAEDHVELVERAVRDEVVLCEDDVLDERALELRAVVLREVVLREGPRAAGADVVLGVLAHLVERENAGASPVDDRFVDIGGVDARTLVDVLFLQQDRERVHLLARRAPGNPDAGEGIRAQQRDHVPPERLVEQWIAEHRRDVHGEIQ